MNALAKRLIGWSLALALSCICVHGAAAGPIVNIDDLTEALTVVILNPPPGSTIVPGPGDEEAIITLPNVLMGNLPMGPVGVFVLTEPKKEDPKQGVSDAIFFDVIGANATDLKIDFLSDPNPGTLPPPGNVYGTAPETGTFQPIPLPPGLMSDLEPPFEDLAVNVASDVVPEPATLILFGPGALMLFGYARRRRAALV
jgi:hypothetical protein